MIEHKSATEYAVRFHPGENDFKEIPKKIEMSKFRATVKKEIQFIFEIILTSRLRMLLTEETMNTSGAL